MDNMDDIGEIVEDIFLHGRDIATSRGVHYSGGYLFSGLIGHDRTKIMYIELDKTDIVEIKQEPHEVCIMYDHNSDRFHSIFFNSETGISLNKLRNVLVEYSNAIIDCKM